MIYAVGLDSDRTFVYLLRELLARDVAVQPINLRAVVPGRWRLSVPDDGSSFVETSDERIALDPCASYFSRIVDLSSVQGTLVEAHLWRGLVSAISSWFEAIPGTVVNRPGGDACNASKPLHEHVLAQQGLRVPESLTSSDHRLLQEFAARGPTVVKTVSGVRANTRLLDDAELARFDRRQGPIHVQRLVKGVDVRAHVVDDTVHAELIEANAVDYRAATGFKRFERHQLPRQLEVDLVRATGDMSLRFAGWDFKRDSHDTYWCLEANPMPGYESYDRRLGGTITDALLRALQG
jgi:hypothetical protein